MNQVSLLGRLVRDPELKSTKSGVSVCSFTLAVDRKFKNANGERETDFINCQAWRQTADFVAKYFSKGQRMAVNGSIQVRSWDDKEGNKRYATEVIVDGAYFCESGNTATTSRPVDNADYTDVDTALPFDL